MDDIVKQAMAKWPNVPDCYGWLGLDARGNWYMRDDRAQASGAFASGRPGAKGSMLQHAKLIEFIERNYSGDQEGCWFFQNGPQRVFVELEATPHIWRINENGLITSNAGQCAEFERCLMDENGWAYMQTSAGFGLVHTQDVDALALTLERLAWSIEDVMLADLPARFSFCASPQARHSHSK
ncbi:MAG: DUF2946 family protein [Rhodoferax sp.]|nr:DUF2946 family protein [Rhodoferax sp.]